jgi:diguanylate cyclase (GGDEF)-like protein
MGAIGRGVAVLKGQLVSSFRVKLVVYFLLLSLLPLVAAFAGFTAVAQRNELRRVDSRLEAGLRASVAGYQSRLAAAAAQANALARDPAFQRAIAKRDARTLTHLLARAPDVRVVGTHGLRVGSAPPVAAERSTAVVAGDRVLGQVVAAVPLDGKLLGALRGRSGLEPRDELVLLRGRRILPGSSTLTGSLPRLPRGAGTVRIGGHRYRAVVATPLDERSGVTLAALTPQAAIDASSALVKRRLLAGLVALLTLVAAVGYLEGRTVVRRIGALVRAAEAVAQGRLDERVEVRGHDELAQLGRSFNEMAAELQTRRTELEAERRRVRDAFSRFGEALGATHDPEQLRRVIVDTAVEATGAVGGRLVGRGGELHAVGLWDGDESLELPLRAGRADFGSLLLHGNGFSDDERLTAASLASHAAVALENARLHRIVERQALNDVLTGLANRRACEEALSAEIARADRMGTPFALVVADLDDFKLVNDNHGHPAGDVVLREFAAVLLESVRESDLAGRFGGEEFVLLLSGTSAEGAAELAERVRIRLSQRTILAPSGAPIRITASFGVAGFPEQPGVDELVAAADAALYAAKRGGKNRVMRAPARLARA